ncbi:MAG: methylamine methyltransferase corrinoid protein reductive activase [Deltaproteobacteria bacterium]|nr:methylamine methyltransferase corrinoid protein reductive activase [Deltaproteobacteria bacterium]
MARLGIALDLGTSGYRGQAIDLGTGAVWSSVVTTRHPLPGANVMDHLHFALDVGVSGAQQVVVTAVNRVLAGLDIEPADVRCLALCGNPIQLSLFQGTEIRDLAYAGKRKLERLGVVPPTRNAQILRAERIPGLALRSRTEVLIPPAVRHEIGADALALLIQTGMLEREEISLATDYGTNAEMALVVRGTVFTGSTAAGPALEGQHLRHGLLALPGAICDVDIDAGALGERRGEALGAAGSPTKRLRTLVLDAGMVARRGDTVNPADGRVLAEGELRARGITGTGVVALLSEGIRTDLIRRPRIDLPGSVIRLPDGVELDERDLAEAGKALGALRAGHLTLCREAGIRPEDVETAYLSGASGTYVDALKARGLGMIPPRVTKIFQVGNTSLAMARDIARDPESLWRMQEMADRLRERHCLFADSPIFEKAFLLELSVWTEGLSRQDHERFLKRYGFPPSVEPSGVPNVVRLVQSDIGDVGLHGLSIIEDISERRQSCFEGCSGCGECARACPEGALAIQEAGGTTLIRCDLARCAGVACRRCEGACPEHVLELAPLLGANAGRVGRSTA